MIPLAQTTASNAFLLALALFIIYGVWRGVLSQPERDAATQFFKLDGSGGRGDDQDAAKTDRRLDRRQPVTPSPGWTATSERALSSGARSLPTLPRRSRA